MTITPFLQMYRLMILFCAGNHSAPPPPPNFVARLRINVLDIKVVNFYSRSNHLPKSNTLMLFWKSCLALRIIWLISLFLTWSCLGKEQSLQNILVQNYMLINLVRGIFWYTSERPLLSLSLSLSLYLPIFLHHIYIQEIWH